MDTFYLLKWINSHYLLIVVILCYYFGYIYHNILDDINEWQH